MLRWQGTTVLYIKRHYTWKHIVTIKGFIANQMYKVLSRDILWCHTTNVYSLEQKDIHLIRMIEIIHNGEKTFEAIIGN